MGDLERDAIVLGDLEMLSGLLDIQNPTQDQIRLYASVVRRLLLDGQLSSAAARRGIKVDFVAPDAKALVRAARSSGIVSYLLGGAQAFGVRLAGMAVSLNGRSVTGDPEARISLSLESFLRQPVAFSNGLLLTRKDIISYIANKAGGVHYDGKPGKSVDEKRFHAIGLLRSKFRIGLVGGEIKLELFVSEVPNQAAIFVYAPEYIDAVYFEFLSVISHMLQSPQVRLLQRSIREDLAKSHGSS